MPTDLSCRHRGSPARYVRDEAVKHTQRRGEPAPFRRQCSHSALPGRMLRGTQATTRRTPHTQSMAARKITITVPEELVEAIKERVDARGLSGCIESAAAHQDAMNRLRELAERLEEAHGAVTDDEQQAALDRIAAIDDWHDEHRSLSDETV